MENLKFRRQVAIGRYVVDFLCLRHRLIVEADGPFHDWRPEHDAERDAWLRSQGFRILRFTNAQISRDWEVLAAIRDAVRPAAEVAVDPSSDLLRRPPSPARGEGDVFGLSAGEQPR